MHPLPPPPTKQAKSQGAQNTSGRPPTIPESSTTVMPSQPSSQQPNEGRKKKRHRAGKKKRNRRQSFAAPSEDSTMPEMPTMPRSATDTVASRQSPAPHKSLYRLGSDGANLSSGSLDSEALLDHRDQPLMRPRRDSRAPGSGTFNPRSAGSPRNANGVPSFESNPSSMYRVQPPSNDNSEDDDQETNDRTPLMGTSPRKRRPSETGRSYGLFSSSHNRLGRRKSSTSSSSTRRKKRGVINRENSWQNQQGDYDVNNPPSVPGSPVMGGYDDVMVGEFPAPGSPDFRREMIRDSVIDVDGDGPSAVTSSPPSPRLEHGDFRRRRALTLPAEDDVCFPTEGISEIAEEDFMARGRSEEYVGAPRRRRRRQWPDLSVLEEWSREEKEERSEGNRAKKISEPVLVGGRLRPQKSAWHRVEEDSPYRFTYFNEEFQSTIHAQTISELVQPGGDFRELFVPDPPELSDDSSDDEEGPSTQSTAIRGPTSPTSQSAQGTRQPSVISEIKAESREGSGQATPAKGTGPAQKTKRYGPRPTFWLDVLCPTEMEMRVISKAFGVHALTAEDIMMQEAREKVELFRNYYFINYRTFEQDPNSEDYLEPVDMYVVVFREGVLSFHFSQCPHPANVRRRIRQLKDYLILSSDWISYAIIDDVTDVFGPLIQSIEEEVDDIDDTILKLHSENDEMKIQASSGSSINEKRSNADASPETVSGGDMLRRVGEGRKKVMGLYRLLGNKADVIKGFAKRCNEQWEVAPKTEIGLYLGDIQDHILTMTSNLSHYETLLSRAHSNYLAQINIRMNERQEKTADVLGKLTVLGTIVLPMNIICGMWGMNVKVPGQEVDNLYWFWSITAGLIVFAVVCFYVAKRVYGIV